MNMKIEDMKGLLCEGSPFCIQEGMYNKLLFRQDLAFTAKFERKRTDSE